MERLKIENFAGIKSMDLEIRPINVFIGPQGTGKSVVAKLLYFFKSFYGEMYDSIFLEESRDEFNKKWRDLFLRIFPRESWTDTFHIFYENENITFSVQKSAEGEAEFHYSDNLRDIYTKCQDVTTEGRKKKGSMPLSNYNRMNNVLRDQLSCSAAYHQVFIPAGRIFFAFYQDSPFSLMREKATLDYFITSFGAFYEEAKKRLTGTESEIDAKFLKMEYEILGGKYLRENYKDYLIHPDGRKVNVANASSGQQETLPLTMVLKTFLSRESATTLYIEEPEAHLFPTAQKRIVQMLAQVFNYQKPNFQIVITTHSPYILTSFNNLLEAGRLAAEKPEKAKEINKIVSKEEWIHPDDFSAYALNRGKKKNMKNIMNTKSGLISASLIDNVSEEIAIEFDKLLDIEFGDEENE